MDEPKAVVVHRKLKVDGDLYEVTLVLTRASKPKRLRKMATIKSEIARLLPGWVGTKIEKG